MPLRRRSRNFHSLKKLKVRQDWNKYNLFNLQRQRLLPASPFTLFQQKWKAKAATRAYHGEQMRETQWKRMFDRRIPAVIPQRPDLLAKEDGSQYAAGRGSGLDPTDGEQKARPKYSPYTQMTYHPIERRLDSAIFRACFASSAKQARQFVTHGHVKVNGQLMRFPGYLLNPGDMFQVDPESVLYATGAGKGTGSNPTFIGSGPVPESDDLDPDTPAGAKAAGVDQSNDSVAAVDEALDQDEEDQDPDEEDEGIDAEDEASATDDPQSQIKSALKSLRKRTKSLLDNPPQKNLRPKQKQALRALSKTLKSTLSRAGSTTQSTIDDLEAQFQVLSERITTEATSQHDSKTEDDPPASLSGAIDNPALQEELRRAEENPVDPSKPYATPWRPREFIAPFIFIPRYLEVNQNICSAVYLRHPVVKPGLAEVPTPFHPETGQLAFTWYLRRR